MQEWGNSFGSKPTYFRRYEVKTRGAIGALLQAKVFNFNQRREVSQVDLPVSWSISQIAVVAFNALLTTDSMVGDGPGFQVSKMLQKFITKILLSLCLLHSVSWQN